MSFLNSLNNKSKQFELPFKHWELSEPLTTEAINEIIKADIANPNEHKLEYDGTRAIDGGEGKFREGRRMKPGEGGKKERKERRRERLNEDTLPKFKHPNSATRVG